jgi:hypothetical protein
LDAITDQKKRELSQLA